jgi:hypothetical protein
LPEIEFVSKAGYTYRSHTSHLLPFSLILE